MGIPSPLVAFLTFSLLSITALASCLDTIDIPRYMERPKYDDKAPEKWNYHFYATYDAGGEWCFELSIWCLARTLRGMRRTRNQPL